MQIPGWTPVALRVLPVHRGTGTIASLELLSGRARGARGTGLVSWMSEAFELISQHRDLSGGLQLRYGTDPTDPTPFILMLQPQHVSRVLGQLKGITFELMEKFAEHCADYLKAKAAFERHRGVTTHVLV
jgi:hypothetical protein